MSGQSTLSDIPDTEGGSSSHEGATPRGGEPKTAFPYPDIGDRIDTLDEEDVGTPTSFEDLNTGPNLAAGPWRCSSCGGASEDSYRCSECGHDMAGDTSKGVTRRGN